MSNKYIVGLDIGTTKIACFIGERADNDKIRIVGFGKTESLGVERGIVLNIRSTADSIRRAVNAASEQANYEVSEVYVGIAGQHIKSRTNRGTIMIPEDHRQIEEADVNHLIEDQYRIMLEPGETIIHVFPQIYTVDNEQLPPEIDPVGVAGKCLEATFHIVTSNTTHLRNIKDAVESAGLKIKDVVLEPIASAFSVLDSRDKSAGVALVDIGGGTTDIAIFQDGIIRHTSVLPLAGNSITNDIRENCKILKNQAESLKTKFGSCQPNAVNQDDIVAIPGIRNQPAREISVRTLAGIIKARMQIILEQVAYEIQISGFENKLIAGVVLTGGGARMKNVREFSEFIVGIDSRIGDPDEHLAKDGTVCFEDLSHPMYATGVGLVIYGILKSENKLIDDVAENDTDTAPKTEDVPVAPASKEEEEIPVAKGKNRSEESKRSRPGINFKQISAWITNKFTEED